jgi:2,3-dihydroxyphenylpropionate 1,2-dioxygenase
MHHEGAGMITRGERTAQDMRLNAASDKRFLDVLLSGNLQLFDRWDQDALVEQAGVGSMELQTWIAATSAHLAFGGAVPQLDVYSVAPEIGIACGIVHG